MSTANNYCINLQFTLEVPVKSNTITQMMTDALIREWQTTRGVNVSGVFPPFPKKKTPDHRLTPPIYSLLEVDTPLRRPGEHIL